MRLALTLVTAGFSVDKLGLLLPEGRGQSASGGDLGAALGLVLAGGVLANLALTRFLLQRRVIEGPQLRTRVLLDVTLVAIAGTIGTLVVLFLLRTG
jgi:uncharacterized membrane protein YidH (DUF202 family)